jgi:RNA polymerase sigma factor (sigma-70 family)
MLHAAINIDFLVAGSIRQQAAAQQALLEHIAPTLHSVARRYARSQSDAADILQDSLIRILEQIKQYQPERGPFMPWARTITMRTAISRYRRHRYQYEKTADILPDTLEISPKALSQLAFDDLLVLVQKLPEGQREVFNMAVFDDFSHDQIASELGIAVGTSRSLLSRARQTLQQQIQQINTYELARI